MLFMPSTHNYSLLFWHHTSPVPFRVSKSTVCSFIYISFSQKITSLHIFIGIFLTSHSQEYENIVALNAVVDNDTWKEKKPAELVTILYGINRFLGHTWYAFGPQLHVFAFLSYKMNAQILKPAATFCFRAKSINLMETFTSEIISKFVIPYLEYGCREGGLSVIELENANFISLI